MWIVSVFIAALAFLLSEPLSTTSDAASDTVSSNWTADPSAGVWTLPAALPEADQLSLGFILTPVV
ncbi:MAG: hypothetical protein AAF658_20005, partial [Myxococcota bacterium]